MNQLIVKKKTHFEIKTVNVNKFLINFLNYQHQNTPLVKTQRYKNEFTSILFQQDAILKKAMPQIENYVRNYDMLELPIFSIDNSNKLKEVGRKFDGLQVVEFDPTKVVRIPF